MKTIAIHQPNYIPWPGYFYKIHQSDVFVFLDDVQYSNQGMHNYHFIKTRKGPVRLKVPVIQSFGDLINKVRIRYSIDWRNKHLNQIQENYRQSEYFDEIYNDYQQLLMSTNFEYLQDLNIHIIEFISKKLGIQHHFIKSSSLKSDKVREEKIIDICKKLEGSEYLSGTGARSYQKEENFLKEGLNLKYSEFKVVTYPQQFDGFQSNVSIIDYLMNCGYDWDKILNHQK